MDFEDRRRVNLSLIDAFQILLDHQRETNRKLDVLLGLVYRQGVKMSAELDALTTEVATNTTVDQSAIVLLNGLAAQIESLKTDPAALQALADQVRASSTDLAAAVTANTPPVVEPPVA